MDVYKPISPYPPLKYDGSHSSEIDYLQLQNAQIIEDVGYVKGKVKILHEDLVVFRQETRDNFIEVKQIVNDILYEIEKNKFFVIKSVFFVVVCSMYGKNLIDVIINAIFK